MGRKNTCVKSTLAREELLQCWDFLLFFLFNSLTQNWRHWVRKTWAFTGQQGETKHAILLHHGNCRIRVFCHLSHAPECPFNSPSEPLNLNIKFSFSGRFLNGLKMSDNSTFRTKKELRRWRRQRGRRRRVIETERKLGRTDGNSVSLLDQWVTRPAFSLIKQGVNFSFGQ